MNKEMVANTQPNNLMIKDFQLFRNLCTKGIIAFRMSVRPMDIKGGQRLHQEIL